MMYNNKKVLDSLKKLAKKSKTTIAKKASMSEERSDSVGVCLAKEIFFEGIEAYKNGEMDWDEMVDDVAKTLRAIDESMLMQKVMDEKDED